jgi:hypothetical protein
MGVRGIAPALSAREQIHGEVGHLAKTLWFRLRAESTFLLEVAASHGTIREYVRDLH